MTPDELAAVARRDRAGRALTAALVPLSAGVSLLVLAVALDVAGAIAHNGPAERVLAVITLSVLGLALPAGAVVFLLGSRGPSR